MRKLLIVRDTSSNYGGVERQIVSVAGAFYEMGLFQPILITSKRSSFSDTFLQRNWKVFFVDMGSGSILLSAIAISKIVVSEGVTVIQTHMFRESIVARIVKAFNPSVLHLFRPQTYIDCAWIPEWKKSVYHLLDKLTSSFVDIYLANGNYLANELLLKSHVSRNKIAVLLDGVSCLGDPAPPDIAMPRRIAMVANLGPHKGHLTLIHGLGELRRRGVVVQARIIGGEQTNNFNVNRSYQKMLLSVAKEQNVDHQLDFLGATENIYEAIKDFPVVVLPSDREGVPNCILEAMSVKKIVVCTETGGVPEFIVHGVNGFMHKPFDVKGFADVLGEIFTTPVERLVPICDAAFQTWKELCSLERMVAGYLGSYSKLGLISECAQK